MTYHSLKAFYNQVQTNPWMCCHPVGKYPHTSSRPAVFAQVVHGSKGAKLMLGLTGLRRITLAL